MKHTFQDVPEAPPFSPENDYILVVIACEKGYTPKGDEKVELKLRIEETGSVLYETLSGNAVWKIESFIRACGIAAAKGDEVNLTEPNLIGRRGWAHVFIDTWKDKKHNKVQRWLNKEKLPRDMSLVPKPEPTAEAEEEIPF
jgi:hypothetical protein